MICCVSATSSNRFGSYSFCLKQEKPEKKPGPPPFTHVTADRFTTPSEKMVGFQLTLLLENCCGFQDKISVYIYTSTSATAMPEEAGRPAMDANDIYLASTVGHAGSSASTASAVLKSSLDWTLRAQTEVTDVHSLTNNYAIVLFFIMT